MSTTTQHEFKAEIQQLLDIVVHSLYTDKEIFIRELISNAADALEKLRFKQAAGEEIRDPDLELAISIDLDEKERTITFTDTGIGMNNEELVENLGMIAHSGSKAFVQQIAEAREKGTDATATLIGQFGVGFYSAFMVADKVTVHSRSCRPDDQAWVWSSEGRGSYEIAEGPGDLPRGTRIVVELTQDEKRFSQEATVANIIRTYSRFVPFPINLDGKRQNTVQAIWARNKNEIEDEEYKEFYQYIGHDSEDPMYRLHFSSDAPIAIQSLLFVPSKNFEMPGMPRTESQVSLYCRKILIDARPKDLLPEWMRFVKGVVDSEDLPLNISREAMQDSALMQKLSRVIVKRFIKFLGENAKKDPGQYDKFFGEFGRHVKEGVIQDFSNKEELGKLLRYETSTTEAGKTASLAEYVERMPSGQNEIYYLTAPNREAAESSPYFEVFRKKGFEVLFFFDTWDEFVMDHLAEFEGKKIVSAEKAEIELDDDQPEGEALSDGDAESLAKWMKETLGEKVNEVRTSKRLVDSPAVIVDSDKFMTSSMKQVMKAMNREQGGFDRLDLEINPRHPIVVQLHRQREANAELAGQVAAQVFDNSRAAAGLLEDPREMVQRMNHLLEKVLKDSK